MTSDVQSASHLQRRRLLVHRGDKDHQLVVNAQEAEDIALRHRDVMPQDPQDVMNRDWLVLVQLDPGEVTQREKC